MCMSAAAAVTAPQCEAPAPESSGILIPLWTHHFEHALAFAWTYCALVGDPAAVPIGFILSEPWETASWRQKLSSALSRLPTPGHASCPMRWQAVAFEDAQKAVETDVYATRLRAYQAAASCRESRGLRCPAFEYGVCKPAEGPVGHFGARWRFVALKKLYGLLYFNWSRTLMLDAEARVVRPTSIAGLFRTFGAAPSYWYSSRPRGAKVQGQGATIEWDMQIGSLAAKLLGWKKDLAGLRVENMPRREIELAYDQLGLPQRSTWMDVQHWFYDRWVVQALAARLTMLRGSVERGLCHDASVIWDPILLNAHMYNATRSTGCHPYYDMHEVLRGAGLQQYATTSDDLRISSQPPAGFGEKLLWVHVRQAQESDRRAADREKLLSILDDPARPILVYREPNQDPYLRLNKTQLPEVVCRSQHLTLSVCSAPERAFWCRDGGALSNIAWGLPRRARWPVDLDLRLGIRNFTSDRKSQRTVSV